MPSLQDDRRPAPPSLRDRGVLAAAVLMAAAMVLAPALPAPALASTATATTTGTTTATTTGTGATTASTRTGPETYAEQLIATAQDTLRRDPAAIGSDQAPVTELVWAADLADLARGAADRMAATGILSHDPAVGATLCCGAANGDNLGHWPASRTDIARLRTATQRLVAAWSASDTHRDNILDARFTHVGVGGHLDAQGQLWAAVVFQDRRAGIGGLATSTPQPRELETAGPAIERLAAAGIVTGRPDGEFRPGVEVTRGQLAAQLDAAVRALAGEAPTPARGYFTDVGPALRFSRAIDVTAELGLMAGDASGRFRPDSPLRRDHAATVIARLLDHLES